MKQAIGYIRVSTEGQVVAGISMDAQRARIAAWCEANDYNLVTVYEDAGISGKSMRQRDGLKAALAAARNGVALVCYSMSRLARSLPDMLAIAEQVKRQKADLVSLSERIDTTSAGGKLQFHVYAALVEHERDLISERTREALAYKKAAGEVYAPVPFGYEAVEGRLREIKGEALIVAEILRRRDAGDTLAAIAQDLNERGIVGKRGGRWHPSTVRYLVSRQAA
jgi:site-specific DNA recombinase